MGRKIEGSGLLDTKPPRHTNQYQGASRLQHSTDPDESAANTVAQSPGPRICGAKLNCRFLLSLTIAGLHETASLPGPDPPGAIHLRGSRSDRGRHRGLPFPRQVSAVCGPARRLRRLRRPCRMLEAPPEPQTYEMASRYHSE